MSCFERIVLQGYHSLNLIHYFTAGEDEVKCWTIRDGTKAPAAAGVIHTGSEFAFFFLMCVWRVRACVRALFAYSRSSLPPLALPQTLRTSSFAPRSWPLTTSR